MSFEENKQYEEEKKEESQFTSELQDTIEEQREEIEEEEEMITQEPEPEPEPEPEEVKEETVAPVKAAPPAEEKKKKEERISYSHIDVDLWRTKMHKEEWGIRLDAQRAQKDRQWTRDMDAIGTVKVDGKDYGLLAIREGLWKGKDPLERRFVMKLFSPSGYWRASIERLQGESFANSHATKEPCPSYVCIFKHTRNLYRIQRQSHFPRFQGQIFGFSYLDENDVFRSFVIDDKRLKFGSDWVIKNIHNKVIAKINGKFLNIGGRFKIDIFEEKLAKDKTFFNILILFSSTLRFYRNIKKNIKKSLKELKISDTEVKLDDSETNLYLNPRKLSI